MECVTEVSACNLFTFVIEAGDEVKVAMNEPLRCDVREMSG